MFYALAQEIAVVGNRIPMALDFIGLESVAGKKGAITGLGGGEEGGLNAGKILLFLHPAHQHRTHHATPTDQTYFFHNVLPWIAAYRNRV